MDKRSYPSHVLTELIGMVLPFDDEEKVLVNRCINNVTVEINFQENYEMSYENSSDDKVFSIKLFILNRGQIYSIFDWLFVALRTQ